MTSATNLPKGEPVKPRRPSYVIDHGLLVDASTTPPACCGYILNMAGHGAFAPDGRIECTDEQIAVHNRLLSQAEWAGAQKHGRATLYLSKSQHSLDTPGTRYEVTTWPGDNRAPCYYSKLGRHNFAGRRIDVWFNLGGRRWHGVNLGDSQLVHCRAIQT